MAGTGKTLDDFLTELQDTVDERVEDEFGPVILGRWRSPAHFRQLADLEGLTVSEASANGIIFAVRVDGGVVAEALYYTERCGAQAACCETAALLAQGRTAEEAARITARDILDDVGGLPQSKSQYAARAASALRRAIRVTVS